MSLDFSDQIEEIEVLQSIFPTEFTLISDATDHKFKILLEPTTVDADNHGTIAYGFQFVRYLFLHLNNIHLSR